MIGVLPAGFTGTVEDDVSELWLPIRHYAGAADLELRNQRILWTVGRLAPGVRRRAAEQEVAAIGRRLAAEHDGPEAFGTRLEPLGESWREGLRPGLLLLLVASALLLLIACADVAHLLLARLGRRGHELAVRRVLGASRGRVLRQLLAESLVLAAAGGAAGVGLAAIFVELFLKMAGGGIPGYVTATMDGRVVAAALGVVALTGVLFGTLPAWLGARPDAAGALRSERGASAGRRQRRTGRFLVAAEVASTLVLLLAASLVLRSFHNLRTVDLGYDVDRLLRLSTTLDRTAFPEPGDWVRAAREARAALAREPGVVEVAAAGGVLPPSREVESPVTFAALSGAALEDVYRHPVDAGFFRTLGIAIRHGRAVSARDRADAPRVAVVSESLARRVGRGDPRRALGEPIRFRIGLDPPRTSRPYEIVGVAADVLYDGPTTERPHAYDLYVPLAQVPDYLLSFAVRTTADPAAARDRLRRTLSATVFPSPVHWVQVVRERLAEGWADTRFYALLTGVYSASALLLALIGIYGVLAHAVGRRRRELGIRAAVGARRGQLLRLVVGESLRTVLVGVAAGLALALWAGRGMGSLLYGVSPGDPTTVAAVVAGLCALALAASLLPARRATRVDPAEVLREG